MSKLNTFLLVSCITFLLSTGLANQAFAEDVGLLSSQLTSEQLNSHLGNKHWLIAQSNDSDAYDPFIDYSEFEEASEEEADINFFRNGRFFTLGFALGYRGLTETQASMYSGAVDYGLYLSYFFDLRFALQLSYATGNHDLNFTTRNNVTVNGTSSISDITVSLKYYFNTQNVTRGLAQFNPYLIGGISQYTRTTKISKTTQDLFGKEDASGFTFGVGMEFPMLRGKMYFGGQATYSLVNFPDENTEIELETDKDTGIYPSGDLYNLMAVIGVNF